MRSRWLWLGFAVFLVLLLATGFGFGYLILADTAVAAPDPAPSTDQSQSASFVDSPKLVSAHNCFLPAVGASPRAAPDQSQSASAESPKTTLVHKTFLPSVGATSLETAARDEAAEKNVAAVQEIQTEAQSPTVPANPPVPGQGGTCIVGYIVDRYHQKAGDSWKVTVTSDTGVLYEETADANGYFEFDGLGGGIWTVELAVPEGWQPFTSASFPVTLSGSGDECAKVRFKVEALACVEITKLDARGQMGFDQKVGIAGWQMTATHDSTTLDAVTDWQGQCRFENLVPGTWTIEEESRTGWRPAPGETITKTIDLESPHVPGTCKSLAFVNQQVHGACIYARKVDTEGKPLAGWGIKIKRPDGTHPDMSKVTNHSGYVEFCQLALGDWVVEEEVKDWWRSTGPTEQRVTLTDRGSNQTVVFENEPLGCIDGYKINQLNQGLAGWTIVARNDGEEHTIVTNDQGYFQIKVPLGSWTVSETLQTGWEPVTLPQLNVDVTQPFVCEHIRFKNETRFACLDVFKLDAFDGAGLPDWEITVQPAYGGTPIKAQTDGTGYVRFSGLMPGTYIVSEETQDGWVPVTKTSQQVTLEATGHCQIITFRNRQAPEPPDDPPERCCRAHHTVRWSDTLSSIARHHGTTVGALVQANGLQNDTIHVGQALCIP